jgi:DNA-binding NtrC family response regulator
MSRSDTTTVSSSAFLSQTGRSDEKEGDFLLVVGAGQFLTVALPEAGQVVLGRDQACEVPLEHSKVSRRHATVQGGQAVTVQDLGSTNGIRIAGRKISGGEPVPLAPGDSFQLGPFTIVHLRGQGSSSGSQATSPRAALTIEEPTRATPVVARIAQSPVSVLLQGETGVGKEVLAQTLHRESGRKGSFLGINCAALSEGLLESELFGHERGAFTGAVQAKAGLFESAAGGTVFLDEIGDMPLGVQAKLLRAIEARQVLRLGSVRPMSLDVRFLSATHRDLREDVARGTFRLDLYYRLNGITLVVLPLRDRRGAIGRLTLDFLAEAALSAGGRTPRISPEALALLQAHPWPGNVRELRSVIHRAVLLAHHEDVSAEHLVLDEPVATLAPASSPAEAPDPERDRIIAALDACAGNQTRAAKVLGVSRATLVHKLALHRIPRPRS